MTEPTPVVTPAATPVVEVPKTKEEWAKLSKDNPEKFIEFTQARMDTIFRQNKEKEEELQREKQEKQNLLAELQKLKTPAPVEEQPINEKYGRGRYPQTEEEWNDLFLERPVFANDLRNIYLNEQRSFESDFETTRSNAVKVVQQEHPEMYIFEQDELGKPKKDDKGKVILKTDVNGLPLFNPESEKGKLWTQIFNEDPKGWTSLKNAPTLMMAEMERRLRQKGANMIQKGNEVGNQDQSGVAPEGVPPPKAGSSKFASKEEEQYAEKAISRGVYKNKEEYLKWRDSESVGYAEENRRPDFSKK